MKLDEVLLALGAYGRYQVLMYFVISIFDNFPSIIHMSVMPFLGYEPNHHCKVPEGANKSLLIPVHKENGDIRIDKCNKYEYVNGTYSNKTVPCGKDGWTYERHPIRSSVVTEWNLVCDKNVLPEMSQMLFNIGVMIGAMLCGFLSDKFGRKKTFIAALIIQAIVGTGAGFAPNFYLFVALRIIVGACEQGINITGFIMATELFPPKQRTIFAVGHEFFWAIGGAFLPILAYFIRDWRPLQIAISAPTILGIFLWWVIPESVVWLIGKGRLKEAEAILEKAAKFNKRPIPPNCLTDNSASKAMTAPDDIEDVDDETAHRTYTVIDMFRTPNMRKITFCVCGVWVINTMVYYGLSYNTPNLYGDMYLNFLLGQFIEIPSVIITMILLYKIGRRWPLCLFHVFGGLVCIIAPFLPTHTSGGTNITWIVVTLALLGKGAINGSFTIIYMYGPEIYPTVLRNTGAGLASSAGRLGGILYPYVNYLSKVNNPVAKQLPLIVFGALSVAGGFLALPLPETRNKPLPRTVEDVENYDEFCKRHLARLKEFEMKEHDGTENGKTKSANC